MQKAIPAMRQQAPKGHNTSAMGEAHRIKNHIK